MLRPVKRSRRRANRFKECDLYPPLKSFLEAQGYTVKGEVENCDAVAVRAAEPPVVVELKLALNLKVMLQAVARLVMTPNVYIGIASSCPHLRSDRRKLVKLLRMLGLGLISINPRGGRGAVQVLLDPGTYRPRVVKRRTGQLLGEFQNRIGDPNIGGIGRRRGIMTAYRQRALRIAEHLQENGPAKASAVAEAVGDPKARDLLYRDVYGWFAHPAAGTYALSPRGHEEIASWGTDTIGPDDEARGGRHAGG
jgi:hypothetical protein